MYVSNCRILDYHLKESEIREKFQILGLLSYFHPENGVLELQQGNSLHTMGYSFIVPVVNKNLQICFTRISNQTRETHISYPYEGGSQ